MNHAVSAPTPTGVKLGCSDPLGQLASLRYVRPIPLTDCAFEGPLRCEWRPSKAAAAIAATLCRFLLGCGFGGQHLEQPRRRAEDPLAGGSQLHRSLGSVGPLGNVREAD